MYCTKCGALLEPEALFCQECGTRVAQAAGAETAVSSDATQALDADVAASAAVTQALGSAGISSAQTRALNDLPSIDGRASSAPANARDGFANPGQTMQMPVQQPASAASRRSVPPIQQGAAQPKAMYGAIPKRRSMAPGIILAVICALAIVGIAFFVLNPTSRVSTASSSSSSAASQSSASSQATAIYLLLALLNISNNAALTARWIPTTPSKQGTRSVSLTTTAACILAVVSLAVAA